ncbi:MAG: 1-acyl-sn-glycerol-3-phosphate acyltransferase [Alphaproteobacteria bacterium]|nr:1-acyl-sn-glycerol-3-phosphate acyltransferase [Alphaproteobacteria bacterium]
MNLAFPVTIFRSAIFFLWFALVSAILSVTFLPALLLPRRVTVWMSRWWSRLVLWGLKVFAGTGFEVRGRRPPNGVLVAAKHMSIWDTLALYLVLDDPAVVLKRGLTLVPFYGWYIAKAGSIAIDRDGGAQALRRMAAKARRLTAEGRSVLIFPEGTRKAPGAAPDYKPGVAGLYGQLGVACVPAALNSGLFWQAFLKRPGTIVLEFLEPIAPGLKSREFLKLLEARIEAATAALVAEGGRFNS